MSFMKKNGRGGKKKKRNAHFHLQNVFEGSYEQQMEMEE